MIVNVLHDSSRKDRHELITKEIEEQKLEVRWWEACHGEGKPKIHINRCHKMIVQYLKDNNIEEGVIMEDDCHFVVKEAFSHFITNKPKDYDIYLSSIMWGRIGGWNIVEDFSGLQMYMIHNRFYDTFLNADPHKDIDRAIARKGKFLVANPFCTIQHETMSDNAKKIHLNKKHYHGRSFIGGFSI